MNAAEVLAEHPEFWDLTAVGVALTEGAVMGA